MNFSSSQNRLIIIIGVFLFFVFVYLMQVRSQSNNQIKKQNNNQTAGTKVISSQTNSNQQNNSYKNTKQQNSNTEKVTLMEPGLFRVNIPEQFNFPPEKVLQEVLDPVSAQTATAPYYRYLSNDNISTYEVGYIRLPEQNFQLKSMQTILDDLTRGEVSRLSGSLKKETTVNESNHFSKREIEVESNIDNLYAREYLIINRPYAFVICFTSKNPNNLYGPNAQSFFGSFELFEQNGPKTIIVNGHSGLVGNMVN